MNNKAVKYFLKHSNLTYYRKIFKSNLERDLEQKDNLKLKNK